MEELKVHIRHVMLWKFKINKNSYISFFAFMTKVSLLTAYSETGFQSIILVTH